MRQLLAVAGAIERRQQVDVDRKRAAPAKQPEHIVLARLLPPADLGGCGTVIQHQRPDRDVLRRVICGFQQGRPEGQKVRSRACRAFGKQRDRSSPLQGLCNRHRLVLGALAVRPPNVDRRILVSEPVDEGVAKLVLGNECATSRAADHQDVEPADVVADEQRVVAKRGTVELGAGADDPRCSGQEPRRPGRAAENQLRGEMDRGKDGEQSDQPRNAGGGARVQPLMLSVRD